MKEIALMHSSKQTGRKLRWDSNVDGVLFELYIPKWRVPRPWPKRIIVSVSIPDCSTDEASKSSPRSANGPEGIAALEQSIVATVEMVREHTKTVRFAPRGNPEDWEIGEPYIPFALLPDSSWQRVQIGVRWDRSAGTWSDE